LEAALPDCWHTRLRLSEEESGYLRGWMFLAWLPQVLCEAQIEQEILDCQNSAQQGKRSAGQSGVAQIEVARRSRLGAPVATE
jgi:hypothetical protein